METMDRIKHLESKYVSVQYNLIKLCEGDELRFYQWIKLWAINKHSAWPGTVTICQDLSMSRATFFRLIKRIEAKGRLIIKRTSGKNNIYDITWYDMANLDPYQNDTRVVSKRDTPTNRVNRYQNETRTNSKLKENNEETDELKNSLQTADGKPLNKQAKLEKLDKLKKDVADILSLKTNQ